MPNRGAPSTARVNRVFGREAKEQEAHSIYGVEQSRGEYNGAKRNRAEGRWMWFRRRRLAGKLRSRCTQLVEPTGAKRRKKIVGRGRPAPECSTRINQSASQSINQSINQSISIYQSVSRPRRSYRGKVPIYSTALFKWSGL